VNRYVSPTLLRFLTVGGIAYVVNQALLVALYEGVALALLPASALALEASILVRFGLNDRWTFRGRCRQPLWRRFYRFNLSSFGSPLIALAGVNLLTPALGVSYLVANSAGIALGLAWNWYWSNRFVWTETSRLEPERPLQGKRAEAA
jgi:putative flippase GtrA